MDKSIIDSLHTNQRLLVNELIKRGVTVQPIDLSIELLQAKYMDHVEYIMDRFGSVVPYVQAQMTSDKYLSKNIIKNNGIVVPYGDCFDLTQLDRIITYVKANLKFPLVVKPNWGSHGDDVYMNIDSIQKLIDIITKLEEKYGNMTILVEEQFDGKEYRVFITKNGDYAVLHRDPASVIGNGKNTIQELAVAESERRKNDRSDCLCGIRIDDDFLQKIGYDRLTIPADGEKIYVRSSSNIAKGGDCIDVTDEVHESVINIAKQVLESFEGLPYAGIDFMTKDISALQDTSSYNVIEVNTNPGFSMHALPAKGKPRNVAGMVVDILFPETTPYYSLSENIYETDDVAVYVGRFCPIHLGHEAVIKKMIQMFGSKSFLILGSSNAAISLRNYFSYLERVDFVKILFPGLKIIGLPDYHTDQEWIMALDDVLSSLVHDTKRIVFVGGCEEDVDYFIKVGKRVMIINRFDGTTPKISATEVRDALIRGRELDGLLNPKILDTVKNLFETKWEDFKKI